MNKPVDPKVAASFRDAHMSAAMAAFWMPVEDAPHDGAAKLLYCRGGVQMIGTADYHAATHWMPLPAPPIED